MEIITFQEELWKFFKGTKYNGSNGFKQKSTNFVKEEKEPQAQKNGGANGKKNGNIDSKLVVCYKCHKYGHMATNCPQNKSTTSHFIEGIEE